ncbi:Hypothetical predicted protein [Mytilus galloprovincialis]|uniref:Tesmin/TSO1-like CXC domain-containing protein n=1 Tax=Mytilus galloprovincialis TaxID=29158 RepID=A0A8B6FMH0_MYTGA|nr:Hypothetical predicted protein [Mytilus galloprovincialis]
MGDCQAQELPETNIVHVIDGGSLLYRIPWIKGQTFSQICMKYIDHIRKRFSNQTVVMDGYNSSSTKDITHLRRSKGIQSNTITFTRDMPLRIKKETFLLNQSNKQRFVEMLIDIFQEHSFEAIQAKEDADLLIDRTAVEKSNRQEVVIHGEDTDLLILLCHLAEKNSHCIFFTTDKQSAMKNSKVWNIQKTQQVLGEEVCHQLPFVHSITGCDTTSRLHCIGKPAVFKKIKSDRHLQTQGEAFRMESMGKDDICKACEEVLVNLYGGMPLEGLDILRWRKFTTKTMALNRSSIVQVQTLPPTSDAAKFHSMRVYLQCLYNEKLFPIEMTKQPAPEFLLKIIHCNCKTDCDNRRCSCRKNGIPCSSGCGECRGINCSNSKHELEELDVEENEDT